MMMHLLGRLGAATLALLAHVGEILLLLVEATADLVRPPYAVRPTVREMAEIGARSTGVVAVLGLCFGMALVQQTGITLKRFGIEQYVGQLVALGMFRELGPVLAGFMVAARAGSGMAAEIGSMKVTEQIDAMRACGGSPVRLLVVPKVAAAALSLPLLTAMANVLGILGGMLIARLILGMEPHFYLASIPERVQVSDFTSGLAKTFFFGIIIGAVSCREGLSATRGSLGVSRATTQAVVWSCMLILVADLLLTGFIFAVGGILKT